MAGIRNVRLLEAAEIECRVSSVSEKGVCLLLFKDARVDQKILDETYTPFGWKRSHQAVEGNLYCTVEVWDGEKQQWIGKQDVGTMSDYEKEKGQASDSFKRACVNWGIGRELYTAPFIWVPADSTDIQKRGEKYVCSERFRVKSVAYSEGREITALEIADSKGKTVYSMRQGRQVQMAQGEEKPQGREAEECAAGVQDVQTQGHGMKAQGRNAQDSGPDTASKVRLMAELHRTGVPLEAVLERYGIDDISRMTQEIYRRAMASLKRTKTADGAA